MLSTYARIYIGLSPILVEKVKKYSRQPSTATSDVLPITILPETQIRQALNHPQNGSMKDLIQTAYKDNINTDNGINDSQVSLQEQRLFIESTLYTLQAAKASTDTSPAFKARIDGAMDSLNKQLRVMNTVQADLNKNQEQSTNLKNEFTDLIEKHDTEWDTYRKNQLNTLRDEINAVLESAGYQKLDPVQGGAEANLLRQDLQETLDFYTERAAKDLSPREMEKMLGLNHLDLNTFFKIKAYLAIRSANPPPPLEERSRLMQKLEKFFEQANREGHVIMDRQTQEIKSLDETKVRPILKTVKSHQQQLEALENDRNVVLAPVTNAKIEQEIQQRIQESQQPRPREVPTPG